MSDWKPERRTDLGTGRVRSMKEIRPSRLILFFVIDESGNMIDSVQADSRAEARRALVRRYSPTRARKLKLERYSDASDRRALRAEARQR